MLQCHNNIKGYKMQYAEIQKKLSDLYLFKNQTILKMAKDSGVNYHTVRFIVNNDPKVNCTQKTLKRLEAYLNNIVV